MTYEDPQSGQRVRRRASRSAGPTGADADAAAVVLPNEKEPTEQGPAEQKSTAPVALGKPDTQSEKVVSGDQVATEAQPTSTADTPAEAVVDAPARSKPKAGLVVGIAAASVIAVALASLTVFLLVDRNNASNADEDRARYVAGAQTTALNLTTLHSETAGADLDKFLAGTTKEFQSQLDGRKDSFVNVLGQVGVQTDGEILEAGFEKADGDCGTSLVAVKAMQKNGDQPEPEERNYRLRITMCDVDGQLLASNVEFVP
ncbi:hypothetical protein O4214_10875 [Rhodococcus erythropolis]|uniref:hypothetical protein n=1 Tax=Rhodococcus erythropolis TaxID=1833 RepID=UPI001E46A126|nr:MULTISPECIES: hypothetical protein [Rhodococcus erythropolis group]MCD2106060.1 hypothetical protein [Rhodococcus qingshengii]MCZ4524484.1 hypothetical protein [Rhodococcus erythropolis]